MTPLEKETVEQLIELLKEQLHDPDVVHVNMLRGAIARPSPEQIIHIYGIDTLLEAIQQHMNEHLKKILATMREHKIGVAGKDTD